MNKIKKLGRASIWVLLGFVLFAIVVTAVKFGFGLILLVIVLWQGRGSLAAADPEGSGRIIGYLVGELLALLTMAFIWLKALRWLRCPASLRLSGGQ